MFVRRRRLALLACASMVGGAIAFAPAAAYAAGGCNTGTLKTGNSIGACLGVSGLTLNPDGYFNNGPIYSTAR